jgi:hypothetical protein
MNEVPPYPWSESQEQYFAWKYPATTRPGKGAINAIPATYEECLEKLRLPLPPRPLPPKILSRLCEAINSGAANELIDAIMARIDFAGNAGKIVQAADVLGGKHESIVREYAKRTMKDECSQAPLAEALARAKEELALLAEEEERIKQSMLTPLRSLNPNTRV